MSAAFFRRDQLASGQALVEFALVALVLFVIVIALFDAGRAVYAFSTINNAAREAARLAIVDQTLTHIQDEGQAQSVGLGIPASQVAVVYRNQDDTGNCSSQVAPPVGCLAAVTVSYTFRPVLGSFLGTINMTGRSFFPIESACVQPPEAKCPKGD
jgi:Flp pilus assembly protein TadG